MSQPLRLPRQLSKMYFYLLLQGLICDMAVVSTVRVLADPPGAAAFGIPMHGSSAQAAHGLFPNGRDAGRAGGITGLTVSLTVNGAVVLIGDQPGESIFSKVAGILQNALDHVLVPLGRVGVVLQLLQSREKGKIICEFCFRHIDDPFRFVLCIMYAVSLCQFCKSDTDF